VIVTIFYWVLIYPTVEGELHITSWGKHTIPIAMLMVDGLFNSIEFVGNHMLFAVMYTGTYATFLVTYTLTTGESIYDVADL